MKTVQPKHNDVFIYVINGEALVCQWHVTPTELGETQLADNYVALQAAALEEVEQATGRKIYDLEMGLYPCSLFLGARATFKDERLKRPFDLRYLE